MAVKNKKIKQTLQLHRQHNQEYTKKLKKKPKKEGHKQL